MFELCVSADFPGAVEPASVNRTAAKESHG
jgi:hypothetical protein